MSKESSAVETVLPPEAREGTFVVIPAFNEAGAIEQVARGVADAYPNVVVVDDGSLDETGAAARRSAKYVLRHAINRGQGAAIQTGIEFALKAGAKYIVTFDADGQHRVEDIAALVGPIWRGECDVALGSRFLGEAEGLSSGRRMTLKLGVLFTRVTSGVKLTDTHNGLRAFSRAAAEQIEIKLDGMAHASELIDLIVRSGLTYKEVPVTVRYTAYSTAKGQSSRGAVRVALHYLVGRMIR
ncbi:MAG TPA: glycosyltransferase family 2 protein [Phycisphaerae bacterium]|nr:glycosyltransferase family 2 protein [Phycisphaerae bacterium]